jgi:hypothetical protein
MTNILRVLLFSNRRNHLSHCDRDRRTTRLDRNLPRLAVQIPRRDIPVLPLTLIHVQLDDRSIRTMKGLIQIQHRLHRVLARRHILQIVNRIPNSLLIHHGRSTRCKTIDGHTKHQLRARRIVDLHPRLIRVIRRQQQQQSPIQRFRAPLPGKTDRKRLSNQQRRHRRAGKQDNEQNAKRLHSVEDYHFKAECLEFSIHSISIVILSAAKDPLLKNPGLHRESGFPTLPAPLQEGWETTELHHSSTNADASAKAYTPKSRATPAAIHSRYPQPPTADAAKSAQPVHRARISRES